MKTHLKHLLGLALMVLVLAGCSNPAGPEIETPVVETPEDNAKLIKVEFRWCTYLKGEKTVTGFKTYSPMYLLDLHFDSEWNSYVYDYPEGYDRVSYKELKNDEERFKEFSEDAFEKVFGTKYYEEGTIVDLKKWTSKAISLLDTTENNITYTYLCFLTEDIEEYRKVKVEDSFDEIEVGNKDIVIYVYWNYFDSLR